MPGLKLLLDTHILLAALINPDSLPPAIQQDISNPANTVLFSAASIWEVVKVDLISATKMADSTGTMDKPSFIVISGNDDFCVTIKSNCWLIFPAASAIKPEVMDTESGTNSRKNSDRYSSHNAPTVGLCGTFPVTSESWIILSILA
jgi:hypothetical protein